MGLLAAGTHAQETAAASADDAQARAPAQWSFSASVYGYSVPDDSDYLQPTFTADRRWLHLEARYNYEELDSGSLWVGYNFTTGDKVALEITPMLGGVFGEIGGVAPGYHAALDWWRLELYTEGEYVFDTGERADSFFYSWTELTLSPVDWLRAGLVTQRTRAYESSREIERGLLVGFSFASVEIAAHVFDRSEGRPMFVLAVAVDF